MCKINRISPVDKKYIDIHTHHENSAPEVITLHSYSLNEEIVHPSSPFCAGIHPWKLSDTDVEQALNYLRTAPLAAIGEIGLDYAKSQDKTLQQDLLKQQLQVAEARQLPVILHCVKAYHDLLPLLKTFQLQAVIFHGYTGSYEQTEKILQSGYYLSLGEQSLRSDRTVAAVRELHPWQQLFLETDTSVLPIPEIYRRASQALQISSESLLNQLYDNYKRIFA